MVVRNASARFISSPLALGMAVALPLALVGCSGGSESGKTKTPPPASSPQAEVSAPASEPGAEAETEPASPEPSEDPQAYDGPLDGEFPTPFRDAVRAGHGWQSAPADGLLVQGAAAVTYRHSEGTTHLNAVSVDSGKPIMDLDVDTLGDDSDSRDLFTMNYRGNDFVVICSEGTTDEGDTAHESTGGLQVDFVPIGSGTSGPSKTYSLDEDSEFADSVTGDDDQPRSTNLVNVVTDQGDLGEPTRLTTLTPEKKFETKLSEGSRVWPLIYTRDGTLLSAALDDDQESEKTGVFADGKQLGPKPKPVENVVASMPRAHLLGHSLIMEFGNGNGMNVDLDSGEATKPYVIEGYTDSGDELKPDRKAALTADLDVVSPNGKYATTGGADDADEGHDVYDTRTGKVLYSVSPKDKRVEVQPMFLDDDGAVYGITEGATGDETWVHFDGRSGKGHGSERLEKLGTDEFDDPVHMSARGTIVVEHELTEEEAEALQDSEEDEAPEDDDDETSSEDSGIVYSAAFAD